MVQEKTDLQQNLTENPSVINEPFLNPHHSDQVSNFVRFLTSRFDQHSTKLKLELNHTAVQLEPVPKETADRLIELFKEKFAQEHADKFGIIIKGIFIAQNFEPVPTDLSGVVFHGTDATRGTKILHGGFEVPSERKVDEHPMYGTGVCASPISSKAAPYFNEEGYSSRKRNDGLIFMLDPEYSHPYEAKSALWGDTITLPDGSTGDWKDTYDAVIALPKNHGGDSTASNFPEVTLKDPSQANPIAVAWTELIPKSDPEYHSLFGETPVKSEIPQTESTNISPIRELRSKINRIFTAERRNSENSNTSQAEAISTLTDQYGLSIVEEQNLNFESQLKSQTTFGSYEGYKLAPKEAIILKVPSESRGIIRNIVLQHRKDRWYPDRSQRRYQKIKPEEVRTEPDGRTSIFRRSTNSWFTLDPEISYLVQKGHTYTERDSHPAQTRIFVHNAESNRWIDLGVKIGEPRPASEPEEERLYDLFQTEITDMVAIVGWGDGNSENAVTNVHALEVINYPELDKEYISKEVVYTNGVSFFEPNGEKVEKYKPPFGFGYPNSVCIGGYKEQPFQFKSEGPSLKYSIPAELIGKKLSLLDIACGDTVFGSSQARNKSGWAEISAHVVTQDHQTFPVISSEGVPPYGILSGNTKMEYTFKAGDAIEITSDKHPSWIMGFRILAKE